MENGIGNCELGTGNWELETGDCQMGREPSAVLL